MDIKNTIEIMCPPVFVFPWIDQPRKAMQWQRSVKGGRMMNETPDKIGTTFKEELEDHGKTLILSGTITEYIPNKLMAFHLESKIHTVDVSYRLEGQNNHTILIITSSIQWKFPMNIITLVIGRKIQETIQKQSQSELTELQRLCEMPTDSNKQ